MENDFFRWKSDPYFPVAEDIQSSADRLESIYRTWQRMNGNSPKIVGESPSDPYPENFSNYQFELNAACDTLHWQVEEFEREINSSKSGKLGDSSDRIRRLNFIHSIRRQVDDIKSKLNEPGFKFEPAVDSSLSAFLSASTSLESTSSLDCNSPVPLILSDVHSFEIGSSGQLVFPATPESMGSTSSLESVFHLSSLSPASEQHPQPPRVSSFAASHPESMPSKCEDDQGIHSPTFRDNPHSYGSYPHHQPHSGMLEGECGKTDHSPLLGCDDDEVTGVKTDVPTNQPSLWKLFMPESRKNKVMKRRQGYVTKENCQHSTDGLVDVEKGTGLQSWLNPYLVSPYFNFESFHSQEERKELPKARSHYPQCLTKPHHHFSCLRTLQIVAFFFLVCCITGFGRFCVEDHVKGSV